jgi:hypothetical protein
VAETIPKRWFGGGFGHPLGSMGVALVPTKGGFGHPQMAKIFFPFFLFEKKNIYFFIF